MKGIQAVDNNFIVRLVYRLRRMGAFMPRRGCHHRHLRIMPLSQALVERQAKVSRLLALNLESGAQ